MGNVRKKRAAWKRLLEYIGIKHKKERKMMFIFLLALVVVLLLIFWLISELAMYQNR